MIKKMVDGVEIICDPEEERQILAYWELNTKYPEYHDAVQYDGASMPVINMDRAKELHRLHLKSYIEESVKGLNKQIEEAQENGDDAKVKSLFAERKKIKEMINQDLSKIENMDDLKAMLPS